ncbi:hypothetical protein GCM10009841_08030 [Microlunatus panaciterrae]|uniref:Acetyltransferase-like isoleucine patch superfamily enzyme n=1 Tax=Microlunatus panaciterrae TaxID=400768 RepID=A0ABS2RIN8_9ACTN|nr:CatB-related O-acetyltransferase [Microlunatus panaciterrae]MBM7798543.1 acetyltransferase-like isoleucine patch superfamily enzyme [Microlunatus panaciterrae]
MALARSSNLYKSLRLARNRLVIARRRLSRVDPTAYVHPSSHVATDLQADEYVFVGRHCNIAPLVEIGRYTMLASNVAIVGDDHNWSDPGVPMQFSGRPAQHATVIGRDVWLGHGVIVMRGVTIGDGAIVAAGAVVTKDIPACEIWAGTPAAKLRARFTDPGSKELHLAMLEGPLVSPRFAESREKYETHDAN